MLMRPVDASTLGIFRICWAVMMCIEANWLHNQMQDRHHPDVFHFHYPGFSWIRHFPEAWMMEVEMIVMLIAAILMGFGALFRPAAVLFTLTYTHFFFSEALTHNNHFYLIILVNFLLIFTGADNAYSVKQRKRSKLGEAPLPVPAWHYLVLKWQVVIVYFYGGIAKINRDWLIELEPVRFWLNHSPRPPAFLAGLIRQDWFTPFTAWGGLFIDLLCPFLLLAKKTRLLAMLILVSFHALNSQIFNIGYFPIIGIILLIPFFPPERFRRRSQAESDAAAPASPSLSLKAPSPLLRYVLVAYFVFQLLFPLRWHLWNPANPSWTGLGQRFAWRMMLRERIGTFEIRFADPQVRQWIAQSAAFLPPLAPTAYISMEQNPHYIWQYVQEIKKTLSQYGKGDTAIHVFATCSLNGRPYYPIINPHVDLAKAEFPLGRIPDWILPLPDLKVDFEQIFPLEESRRFGKEALEKWLAENPGPASSIPPTEISDTTANPAD
jgi:uncharacterized membrane protein YphA (DoxX/SURF4 family)